VAKKPPKDAPRPKDPEDCPRCGGVGAVFDADGELVLCPKCKGSGVK